MLSVRWLLIVQAVFLVGMAVSSAAEPESNLPAGLRVEQQPTDPKDAKIVLIAGGNFFKPGEHEYVAGCAVLMDLLRQTPGVAPVLAVDWPMKPETLAGAKAIVFFFDGGDKHALLKDDRMAQLQKLTDARVGLVQFHQGVDVSKDLGDRMRSWAGAAWEKGYSQRAHWIDEFKTFPDHTICRGVTPFKIDDGWLFKLRFVPEMRGITPLLKTVSPKLPEAERKLDNASIVAWAYDRPDGGRSFTFTGCHLHTSLTEEGYRRFLTNGILWSAGLEIPQGGAPVTLTMENLNKYLAPKPPVTTSEPQRRPASSSSRSSTGLVSAPILKRP